MIFNKQYVAPTCKKKCDAWPARRTVKGISPKAAVSAETGRIEFQFCGETGMLQVWILITLSWVSSSLTLISKLTSCD